jgi:hypothetical protein
MIRFSDIKSVLEKNVVDIYFTSLVSGEERIARCTLDPTYFSNKINQSDSDSILAYRIHDKRWEDIKLNTIIKYEIA